MKRLLIALLVCLISSPAAQAGKVGIISADSGDLIPRLKGPEETGTGVGSCVYTAGQNFNIRVLARKNMMLSLDLVTGEKTESLVSAVFDSTTNLVTEVRPQFEVSSGTSWTLAWVLSRVKGKGHVIDAVEVASGTCP